MTALIAIDLDRTIIYSRTAIDRAPKGPDVVCVETHDGVSLSYMTARAAAQLHRLAADAVVVPVTTRTVTQFRRVDLPGGPWRYAIASNGGTILVGGVPDPQWRARVAVAAKTGGLPLSEMLAALRQRIDPNWVRSSSTADGLFHYLVVDLSRLPSTFLPEWDHWCRRHGWSASQQGRKIYSMPDAVSKAAAVAEVRRRLVSIGDLGLESRLFAAGDGKLDADMLSVADSGIRPRHGALEAMYWTHPTVTVTAASGVSAGEEILTWFAAQIAAVDRLPDLPQPDRIRRP